MHRKRERENYHFGTQDHLQQAYAGQPILLTAGNLPRQSGGRLTTLNFARLALEMHRHKEGDELILWLLTLDAVRATQSICEHWSPAADVLSSWNIIQTPFFRKSTILSEPMMRFTNDVNKNQKKLRKLLNAYMGNTSLAAAIIDNGRDCLGCLKFQYHNLLGKMYLAFNAGVTTSGLVEIHLSNSSRVTAEFIASNLHPQESGSDETVSFYVLLGRTTSRGNASGSAILEHSQVDQTSANPQPPHNTNISRRNEPLRQTDVGEATQLAKTGMRQSTLQTQSKHTENVRSSTVERQGQAEETRQISTMGMPAPTVQTQHTVNAQSEVYENSNFHLNTGRDIAGEEFMRTQYTAFAMQLAVELADEEEALAQILQLSLVEAESSDSQTLNMPQGHEDIDTPAVLSSNSVFECGVCMDNYREELVTRLSDCQHVFCEDCLKGTVQADLKSRKFPVLCPACTEDGRTEVPSVIDEPIIRKLGITDTEMEIFEELQNSDVSIKVTCNSCKNTVFVDRADYNETNEISCPVGCGHLWCKECQKKIDRQGPKHLCDSTAELRSLSKSLGWKQCPGCRTLIEKIKGCNHMTCPAPACNTHFCYKCGGEIIKSRNPDEIRYAVMFHGCKVFTAPE